MLSCLCPKIRPYTVDPKRLTGRQHSLSFNYLHSYKVLAIGIFLMLVLMPALYSQPHSNYGLHANIVYRFTKYIDWPDNKKRGDFIIGVVGDTPMYEELKDFVENKTVGKQKIVIKKFSTSADSYNCHILFLSEEESRSMKKIALRTAGSATLLVSESEGLARKGACINFVIVDDHLKLEINKNNIENRDMSIASELLQLGKIIK